MFTGYRKHIALLTICITAIVTISLGYGLIGLGHLLLGGLLFRNLSKQISLTNQLIKILAVYFILIINFWVRANMFVVMQISSSSMEGTLQKGDYTLVKQIDINSTKSSISRNDIVAFTLPHSKGETYVKRCIGLPNDTVQISNNSTIVNGKSIDCVATIITCPENENYDPTNEHISIIEIVDTNHYFMLGDNRCYSYDSRHFGTIPKNAIVGKAIMIIYSKNSKLNSNHIFLKKL